MIITKPDHLILNTDQVALDCTSHAEHIHTCVNKMKSFSAVTKLAHVTYRSNYSTVRVSLYHTLTTSLIKSWYFVSICPIAVTLRVHLKQF